MLEQPFWNYMSPDIQRSSQARVGAFRHLPVRARDQHRSPSDPDNLLDGTLTRIEWKVFKHIHAHDDGKGSV
jgi:hypothetical protein